MSKWHLPYDGSLPPVTAEPVEYRKIPANVDGWSSERNCRENSPFKVGNVVWAVHGHRVCKVVILHVFAESEGLGTCYRQKYRVLPILKDGKSWGKRWFYVYPDYIERAYERVKLR